MQTTHAAIGRPGSGRAGSFLDGSAELPLEVEELVEAGELRELAGDVDSPSPETNSTFSPASQLPAMGLRSVGARSLVSMKERIRSVSSEPAT